MMSQICRCCLKSNGCCLKSSGCCLKSMDTTVTQKNLMDLQFYLIL